MEFFFHLCDILKRINLAGYEGGETTFYKPGGQTDKTDSVSLKVIPLTGMILLHDHRVLHGVPELKKGTKYVIRSDVMYSTI